MKIHHWGALLFALFAGLTFNQGAALWPQPAAQDAAQAEGHGTTRLVFYQAGGAWRSSVDVQVRDAAGRSLVDTVARGPWLVLQLPAGDYVVDARQQQGTLQRAWFRVVDGQQRELALQFSASH